MTNVLGDFVGVRASGGDSRHLKRDRNGREHGANISLNLWATVDLHTPWAAVDFWVSVFFNLRE